MSRPHVAYAPLVRTTVVIDDEILRHGLVHIVSQVDGVHCVGDRCDSEGLAERMRARQPDVVLAGADSVGHLSVALGDLDSRPKLIAIVDPGRGSADTKALIRAGVDAVVDRRSSSAEVQRILRQVVDGRHVLDAYSVHALVLEMRAEARDTERAESPALTLRENEVLTLLTEGLDNRTIAARLFISEATVKFHLRNVMDKYGVHRRAALVSAALRDQQTQTARV
jgi:DNA-binding NarL/FixJ family response regulator